MSEQAAANLWTVWSTPPLAHCLAAQLDSVTCTALPAMQCTFTVFIFCPVTYDSDG